MLPTFSSFSGVCWFASLTEAMLKSLESQTETERKRARNFFTLLQLQQQDALTDQPGVNTVPISQMSHSMNREFFLLHVSVRMEWQKDFSNFPGGDSPTDRGLAGPTYQVAGSLSHPENQMSIHCNAKNVLAMYALQCLVILQIQFILYSEHSSHPLLSVAGCQLLSHNTHILALIRCSHIKFCFDNQSSEITSRKKGV